MKIIIIGGGASGFFSAINIAQKHPNYEVIILEKTSKLLSKVKISGGGRCNVTNSRKNTSELIKFYPRGQKKLTPVFKQFSTFNMVEWLAKNGVQTKEEKDLRVFPASNSSQTIIDLFLELSKKLNVKIIQNQSINKIEKNKNKWLIKSKENSYECDKLIVATGASPSFWKLLANLDLKIEAPLPSLFTFNIQNDARIAQLQGVSIQNTTSKIAGTKISTDGPILFTHWGLSGPVILKLSAWGARELHKTNYQFQIIVNFINLKAEEAKYHLLSFKDSNPKKQLHNYPLFELPKRFWTQILNYCELPEQQIFGELSKKQINKLIEELTQGVYNINGKSTFKDEFVTCGGVALNEIDLKTFETKKHKNLYIIGEALDIDAITGGFNFQACWSAGWIVSENISNSN